MEVSSVGLLPVSVLQKRGSPVASIIAFGRFDFYDSGAQVGQYLSNPGTREYPRQLDDHQAFVRRFTQ
jgi:hypothetical protein